MSEDSPDHKPPLPSVFLSALGFGAAGSGIGSLVGTFLGAWVFGTVSEEQGSVHERVVAAYGGTFWGSVGGIVLGMLVGVLYAIRVRRSRLRQ